MSNISVRFYGDRNTGQHLSSVQPFFTADFQEVEVNETQPKVSVAAFGTNLHHRAGITEIFSLFLESKIFASAHVGKSAIIIIII